MDRLDRIEKNNEELQKRIAELYELQAKTDAQLAKTDERLKRTSQELSKAGINQGHVAEELIFYSLDKNKKLGKIKFKEIDLNVNARNKKVQDEFDIVMYNGNSIALIEVKYKVHPKDLEKLKTTKITNFRSLFPDFADYKIYLGIGGMSIPKDLPKTLAKTV
jgi:septal ring factor EnvC (AmiA/AmiB activator)